MSDYKRAIETIKHLCPLANIKDTHYDLAIKALGKQIPKTVTHEASLYKCYTCPNCKNVIDKFEQFGESTVRVKYNYCHFCGQKLDWD